MTDRNGASRDGRWYLWVLVCGVCAFATAGCMHSFLNDFVDPSEVGKFYGKPVTREIRATLGLQDEEAELINATEPTPEDTVAVVKDYEISPGDWVEVTVQELIRQGTVTTETRKVSDLGYVSLPVIGAVKLSGLTERQAEDVIKAKLKPEILAEPIVGVVVRQEQGRQFTIVGYVTRPGPVPIPRSDFRMLEAISYAGTLPEEVEKAYVIRQVSRKRGEGAGRATQPAGEPATAPASRPATVPAESTSGAARTLREGVDVLLSDLSTGGMTAGSSTRAASPATASSASQPTTGRSVLSPQVQSEFIQAIVPGTAGSSSTVSESRGATTTSQDTTKELSKWIWLNGEWVELRGEAATQSRPATETAPTAAPTSRPRETPEWETAAAGAEETRVIAVPLKALRAGEARYNIVITSGDVINVPTPEAGKRYYVMGHVRGPGAYAIPMEGITLRAAIAAAGGLDPYAWPGRCEISRLIVGDQQELHQVDLDRIFTMKDPDIKLKAGDVINVGTSMLSPFLVTIANGFRTTYGFGFVYDRNFADIDSFGGQANPDDRRRNEQALRFGQLKAAFPGL
jgi:protein involved in polysaccharide export with SLBB domain